MRLGRCKLAHMLFSLSDLCLIGRISTPILHQRERRFPGLKGHPTRWVFRAIDTFEKLFHQATVVEAQALEFPVILNLGIAQENAEVLGIGDNVIDNPVVIVDFWLTQEVGS